MAAAVHSNVGLQHATMAMFNAWCDRMPVLVLGATGPVDAVKRRPWIDWIHTARDQGALIRGYTKWDDQPASPGAAREALLRGTWIANTAPHGPGLHQSRRRDAGSKAHRAAAADRRRALHAAGHDRGARRPGAASGGDAEIRQAGGDPRRPRLAQRGRLERARRARRGAQRQRRHRSENRRELPDRSSALCRRAARRDARQHRRRAQRRRDLEPRLGRSRRRAALGRPLPVGKDHPDFARLPHPQRLEHGLSGLAAGRSVPLRRS